MYCRHCGAEIDERAYLCVKCGFLNGDGDNYCAHCGGKVEKDADVCMKCGYKIEKKGDKKESAVAPKKELIKSKMAAGLLGIFLGWIGIHNFYLGNTAKAVAQLVLGTVGSCFFGIGAIVSGIWGLIEGILILCGYINTDAKGNPLGD